jgi:CheY-like chemotaxis protein
MGASVAPLRILYVEDNDLVRDITCEFLAQPNRIVRAVATAEEALEQFAPDAFDMVMTDVSLPAMSGLEMTRRILQRVPDMAIVIATGYGLAREALLLGGRVRVLTKPFELAQIEDLLHELFPTLGARISDGG